MEKIDKGTVELLERLSVTLGAMKDAIHESGTTAEIEEKMEALTAEICVHNSMLRAQGGDNELIDRLVRMNRELISQIELVRGIVNADSDNQDNVRELKFVQKD